MSDKEAGPETIAQAAAEGGKRNRSFRRRPRKPRAEGAGGESSGEKRERKPRTPREPREPRERAPFPTELVGRTLVGNIVDIVMRGPKQQYGFIGVDHNGSEVRVYFKLSNFGNADVRPRRGYEVEFTVAKEEGESERYHAVNVRLTAVGRATAAEKEAKIAENRAIAEANKATENKGKPEGEEKAKKPRNPRPPREPKAAGAADNGEKSEKKPRERKPRVVRPEDERSVTLQVSSENSSEVKPIVAVISQSIGKLKHSAVEAFGAPISYSVYHNDTLLTKAVLRELPDGARIHIKEPPAATA